MHSVYGRCSNWLLVAVLGTGPGPTTAEHLAALADAELMAMCLVTLNSGWEKDGEEQDEENALAR